jgi:hypothetical protein
MKMSIEELLGSLRNPDKATSKLNGSPRDTWSRIGNGDKFAELGLEKSDLDDFLKEWVENNPYNAL